MKILILQDCSHLMNKVKNEQADMLHGHDKYGQEVLVIDGKIISVGR